MLEVEHQFDKTLKNADVKENADGREKCPFGLKKLKRMLAFISKVYNDRAEALD